VSQHLLGKVGFRRQTPVQCGVQDRDAVQAARTTRDVHRASLRRHARYPVPQHGRPDLECGLVTDDGADPGPHDTGGDHHVNGIRGPERTRQTVQRRRPQPQDDGVGQPGEQRAQPA